MKTKPMKWEGQHFTHTWLLRSFVRNLDNFIFVRFRFPLFVGLFLLVFVCFRKFVGSISMCIVDSI